MFPARKTCDTLVLMRQILPALAALAALAGCQTRNEMRNLPWDSGIAKTYAAPYDKVRNACEDSLRELFFKINDKESRATEASRYQVLASQGATSGNRYARVHIENQQTQCTVWVVIRSKVDSRENEPTDNLVAEDLHKKIAARVAK
jgi:hypothetical protein